MATSSVTKDSKVNSTMAIQQAQQQQQVQPQQNQKQTQHQREQQRKVRQQQQLLLQLGSDQHESGSWISKSETSRSDSIVRSFEQLQIPTSRSRSHKHSSINEMLESFLAASTDDKADITLPSLTPRGPGSPKKGMNRSLSAAGTATAKKNILCIQDQESGGVGVYYNRCPATVKAGGVRGAVGSRFDEQLPLGRDYYLQKKEQQLLRQKRDRERQIKRETNQKANQSVFSRFGLGLPALTTKKVEAVVTVPPASPTAKPPASPCAKPSVSPTRSKNGSTIRASDVIRSRMQLQMQLQKENSATTVTSASTLDSLPAGLIFSRSGTFISPLGAEKNTPSLKSRPFAAAPAIPCAPPFLE